MRESREDKAGEQTSGTDYAIGSVALPCTRALSRRIRQPLPAVRRVEEPHPFPSDPERRIRLFDGTQSKNVTKAEAIMRRPHSSAL